MANDVATMTLEDELPWRDSFPAEIDSLYDDTGWGFTAETDDLDLLIGNFIYNFMGGAAHPKSQFLCDGWVHNNLIIASEKSERDKPISDNDFHRTGMNAADFYGYDELEVVRSVDSVVWKLGDIAYTCTPPTWHLGGSQGGVEFDLHFRQLDKPVVWSYGPREAAGENGIAGGYCYVTGEGTIKTRGRTLDVYNIAGVHERLAFSSGLDFLAQKRADTTGFGQGMCIHVLEGDVWIWALGTLDELMFNVTVDGQQIRFEPHTGDGSKITYTPLDPWHDRRSGLYMPTRWEVTAESPEGRLELEVTANARGYYPFDLKRGQQLMYWFICMANGSFTFPDGRVVKIENQRAQHEVVRNILVHDETFDGPLLGAEG